MNWLGLTEVAWAGFCPKNALVKEKGNASQRQRAWSMCYCLFSIIIPNWWDSINTFKLYKNRKELRLRLVIWCEESILPNPLPFPQGHLPSLILEMLIPRAKRSKPGFKGTYAFFGFWTKSIGQEISKRCHLCLSTFPFEKPLEVCMWECICIFYLYLHLYS